MLLAYHWDFSFMNDYGSYFLTGVGKTLEVSLLAVLSGFVLGTLVALLRLARFWPFRFLGSTYVEIIRGTPLLVQVMLINYGLPLFLGIDIDIFLVAYLALTINSAAYIAEIMRAGIQAVDKGQMEAARSLGMSRGLAMRQIILPQAFKNVLPALGNEFVVVVKESSVLSVIGYAELTYQSNLIRGATYIPFEPVLVASVIYFALIFTMSKLLGIGERRLKASD